MEKDTIMIIEDDEIIRSTVQDLLGGLGYDVLAAKTGSEAINLAKSFNGEINLAMLDMGLPDMQGQNVYPLLMEARPQMKVLVCSGSSENGPVKDILSAGGQAFLRKPFRLSLLSKKLTALLSDNYNGKEKRHESC